MGDDDGGNDDTAAGDVAREALEAAGDVDVEARRLAAWAASGALLLDMRDARSFARRRLRGSVNIPFHAMDGRLHELPPRTRALAVVLSDRSTEAEEAESGGPGEDGSCASDSAARAASYAEQARVFSADFKGLPWNVWGYFVPTASLFGEAARRAEVGVDTTAVHPRARGRLWEPSDMVARWIPRLEERMAKEWDVEALMSLTSSAAVTDASPPAATETEAELMRRPLCLDMGCGAGRDAVWAALRGWRVLALDSDAKGLARCAALARTHGVADRVTPYRVDLVHTLPTDVLALVGDGVAGLTRERRAEGGSGSGVVTRGIEGGEGVAPVVRGPVRAVIAVRYLHRPLVHALAGLLPPAAAVCWFHFMRGAELTKVGRPNKAKDLLEAGELKKLFGEDHGWSVLGDDVVHLPDGRPISEFVTVNDAKQTAS